MFKLIRNSGLNFIASKFIESNTNDSNPGRGWYRIYTYPIQEAVKEEDMRIVCCKEEQLALLLIDISYYRASAIDDQALNNLKRILTFFCGEKKDLILRFLYDREGKGMEREPSGISVIQMHMRQIGTIVKDYADSIFTLQGLFIGSWGEMHSSKFLGAEYIRQLARTLSESTGDSCNLAVRKPCYLRMLVSEQELSECLENRKVGLYNDGMLGSESDLGTYGSLPKQQAEWEEEWCRQDELDFQDQLCNKALNGGEVVINNPLNDLEQAIVKLQKMHITYLHSLYDLQVLNKWKDTIYQKPGAFYGRSGYDYIGAHLGYRFLVKDVCLKKKKYNYYIEIELHNTGFSNAYEKMQATLLLKYLNQGVKEIPIIFDVRKIGSNKTSLLSALLGKLEDEEAEVWFELKRSKDQRRIQLANEGAGEDFLLGKLCNLKAAK